MNSKEIKQMLKDAQKAQCQRDRLAKIAKVIRSDYAFRKQTIDFRINKEHDQVEIFRHRDFNGRYLDVDIVEEIRKANFACFVRVIDGEPTLIAF